MSCTFDLKIDEKNGSLIIQRSMMIVMQFHMSLIVDGIDHKTSIVGNYDINSEKYRVTICKNAFFWGVSIHD